MIYEISWSEGILYTNILNYPKYQYTCFDKKNNIIFSHHIPYTKIPRRKKLFGRSHVL